MLTASTCSSGEVEAKECGGAATSLTNLFGKLVDIAQTVHTLSVSLLMCKKPKRVGHFVRASIHLFISSLIWKTDLRVTSLFIGLEGTQEVQPPTQSRASYNVRPGSAGLYPVGS